MYNQFEPEPPRTIGPYIITGKLGSGSFATVYSAQHNITGVPAALKCIAKSQLCSKDDLNMLQREVNLMKTLDHPFVTTLYEILEDDYYLYLAMEFVENGNLLDFINAHMGLQEEQARRIFVQLITVIDYLHNDRCIVHRDLKAENVLLDKYNNVRLVDFGLSRAFSKVDPFLQTTCGSPAYLAPEIIREQPYTATADIWSIGVLLYAMVVGALPFGGENISALLNNILNTTPLIPNCLSPELRHLLQRLLVKDPNLRITLKEIENHPWFTEFADSKLFDDKFGLIEALRVVDPHELDSAVVSEMRILGIDTAGLITDLTQFKLNSKTAIYKMLRRQRASEEINNWQKCHVKREAIQKTPTEIEQKLPILNPQNTSNQGAKQRGNKNAVGYGKRGGGVPILVRTRKSVPIITETKPF